MVLTLDDVDSISKLRQFFADIPSARLEVVIKNLTEISAQKKAEEQQEKLKHIMELMKEAGISREEVYAGEIKPSSEKIKHKQGPRGPAKIKYRWTDADGKECLWSGRGQLPRSLRALLSDSVTLDNFLIDKEQ